MSSILRIWQNKCITKAYNHYVHNNEKDFLICATPGSGKTICSLYIYYQLNRYMNIRNNNLKLIIIVPTEHLKKQWHSAAFNFALKRIELCIDFTITKHFRLRNEFDGIILTYTALGMGNNAAQYAYLFGMMNYMVIFDEIHHASDNASWGLALYKIFLGARYRLSLSGTPFRSDKDKIPFIKYRESYNKNKDLIRESIPNYTYDYNDALTEGIVRDVIFINVVANALVRAFDDSRNEMIDISASISKKGGNFLKQVFLNKDSDWIITVLRDAHNRLTSIRNGDLQFKAIPDAGGLIIASNTKDAEAYRDILQNICNTKVMIATSDRKDGHDNIREFTHNSELEWLVAVRMVSEGVDIPRLMVGVYATVVSTELFFIQAIGRFVRKRNKDYGCPSVIYIPAISILGQYASNISNINIATFIPNKSGKLILQGDGSGNKIDNKQNNKLYIVNSDADIESLIYRGAYRDIDEYIKLMMVHFNEQNIDNSSSSSETVVIRKHAVDAIDDNNQNINNDIINNINSNDSKPTQSIHDINKDLRDKLAKLVHEYKVKHKLYNRIDIDYKNIHIKLRRATNSKKNIANANNTDLIMRIRTITSWIKQFEKR